MLSYRHAFHAGNFADVLKHYVLVECLHYFTQKNKPFDYIDTHAGAGAYVLDGVYASKTLEFEQGIAHWFHGLRDTLPDLGLYLQCVRQMNADAALRFYPGSPLLAKTLLRESDVLWCFELHASDFVTLQKNLFDKTLSAKCRIRSRNIHIRNEDAYKALVALLPTVSRRALVLMDPSYEIKSEYEQVLDTLLKAYKKMPNATYVLWYPVVERARIVKMEKRIANSELRDVVLFELGVREDSDEKGMTSAGMILVNAPYTLFDRMQALLPMLANVLTQDGAAHWRCERLKAE